MSRPPTENAWLRLEPPFYLEAAVRATGLESGVLSAEAFADDSTAAKVNAALRASCESHQAKDNVER